MATPLLPCDWSAAIEAFTAFVPVHDNRERAKRVREKLAIVACV